MKKLRKQLRRQRASGLTLLLIGGLSACGGSDRGQAGAVSAGSSVLLAEAVAETWIKCADEWGTCTVPGTAQVRYGLSGQYATKTASGSIGCNNNVFGDPFPGADKICEYLSSTPSPTPSPAPTPTPAPIPAPGTGWTQCAVEEGLCSVPGTTQVRYGLNGTYAALTVTGSVVCSNSVFGDPLPGADKICE